MTKNVLHTWARWSLCVSSSLQSLIGLWRDDGGHFKCFQCAEVVEMLSSIIHVKHGTNNTLLPSFLSALRFTVPSPHALSRWPFPTHLGLPLVAVTRVGTKPLLPSTNVLWMDQMVRHFSSLHFFGVWLMMIQALVSKIPYKPFQQTLIIPESISTWADTPGW